MPDDLTPERLAANERIENLERILRENNEEHGRVRIELQEAVRERDRLREYAESLEALVPRCPDCGYTEDDVRTQGDHGLCKGPGPVLPELASLRKVAEAQDRAIELQRQLDDMQAGRWPYIGSQQPATLDPMTVYRARGEASRALRDHREKFPTEYEPCCLEPKGKHKPGCRNAV